MIVDFAGEPLIRQICHELHGPLFLVCPTSSERVDGGKLIRFPI